LQVALLPNLKSLVVQIDKTTLQDLSFLEGSSSIFSLLNRCTTQAGSDLLRRHIQQPPDKYSLLVDYQDAVQFWRQHLDSWHTQISNGTWVMVEKFYESAETGAHKPNRFSMFMEAMMQKLFNKNKHSFIRFSVTQLVDFLQGCASLVSLLKEEPPSLIRKELQTMDAIVQLPLCVSLRKTASEAEQQEMIRLSYHARRDLARQVKQLMASYARLDALQSMARAGAELGWSMPELLPSESLCYEARQLFHPLLPQAVAYDIAFSKNKNFLFLTGANMSGKSTLLRAVGTAALLAHLGMAVPAAQLRISFLKGIITNMQVEDNIFKGESYFFAEVQRMKLTAQKLSKHPFMLVLMDELFKGTNVHDAYQCSRAVIKGLLQQTNNLLALSTHLNELAEELQKEDRVIFRYCYTNISAEGNYRFTYQLMEGVSKDRIGYLVLKKEGVLDLLQP